MEEVKEEERAVPWKLSPRAEAPMAYNIGSIGMLSVLSSIYWSECWIGFLNLDYLQYFGNV